MNARPVVGSSEAALDVGFWVISAAADVDERPSAYGRQEAKPERLRVGLQGCETYVIITEAKQRSHRGGDVITRPAFRCTTSRTLRRSGA